MAIKLRYMAAAAAVVVGNVGLGAVAIADMVSMYYAADLPDEGNASCVVYNDGTGAGLLSNDRRYLLKAEWSSNAKVKGGIAFNTDPLNDALISLEVNGSENVNGDFSASGCTAEVKGWLFDSSRDYGLYSQARHVGEEVSNHATNVSYGLTPD